MPGCVLIRVEILNILRLAYHTRINSNPTHIETGQVPPSPDLRPETRKLAASTQSGLVRDRLSGCSGTAVIVCFRSGRLKDALNRFIQQGVILVIGLLDRQPFY